VQLILKYHNDTTRFLFLSAYPHIKPPHYPVEAFYQNAQANNLIQKVHPPV